MNTKVQSKLMSIETLESLQELTRKLEILWSCSEPGSERRAVLREVCRVTEDHIIQGLGRDPKHV